TRFSRDWSSDVCSSDLDAGRRLAQDPAGIGCRVVDQATRPFAALCVVAGHHVAALELALYRRYADGQQALAILGKGANGTVVQEDRTSVVEGKRVDVAN